MFPSGAGPFAMGVVHSDAASSSEETDGDFVLISNKPDNYLYFDPSQSYAVGYGINYQTNPRFKHRELGSTVVKDAFRVLSALEKKGAVPQEHTMLLEAKLEPQSCTLKGMKASLQEQARKVGEDGVFFLHFSGHGIKVGNSEFGLAPVDFDYTAETYVTARELSQWLQEAGCRAKYILFTLDCCYAGGIAEALTRGSDVLEPISGLYVIASCTANETSVVVGTLGNSIFCYFLGHAILSTEFRAGQLPVRTIYDKCMKLSVALSSLLVCYDEASGLRWKTMQPELTHYSITQLVLELSGEGKEQTDASVMRYGYATELYNYDKPVLTLDDKCMAWIEMCYARDGVLRELKEEGILGSEQCVRDTVLCSMMYSVAAIQLACRPDTVANTNLCITAYMYVVAAIDMVEPGVVFQEREFALGLGYYQHVLQSARGNSGQLKTLFDQLLKNLKAKLATASSPPEQDSDQDMTDSGEVECVSAPPPVLILICV